MALKRTPAVLMALGDQFLEQQPATGFFGCLTAAQDAMLGRMPKGQRCVERLLQPEEEEQVVREAQMTPPRVSTPAKRMKGDGHRLTEEVVGT